MVFGKDRNLGIRLNGLTPEVVTLGNGITIDDLLIHDERAGRPDAGVPLEPFRLSRISRMSRRFAAVDKPTYDGQVHRQVAEARAAKEPRKLAQLLAGDETWAVA